MFHLCVYQLTIGHYVLRLIVAREFPAAVFCGSRWPRANDLVGRFFFHCDSFVSDDEKADLSGGAGKSHFGRTKTNGPVS